MRNIPVMPDNQCHNYMYCAYFQTLIFHNLTVYSLSNNSVDCVNRKGTINKKENDFGSCAELCEHSETSRRMSVRIFLYQPTKRTFDV